MAAATTKTAPPKATKTGAGVRKGRGPKGGKARTAMVKMQAFFKQHREEYKHLEFKEQQKELGKKWKASSENPKNQA